MYQNSAHLIIYYQLEIEKSAVPLSEATLAQIKNENQVPIAKYNFDILLREKYPFEPPQITTRTRVIHFIFLILVQFGSVPLADGRDLFKEIAPKNDKQEAQQWSP